MKIKSEIFIFLIIICILFSISAVSASEIQSDINDNNYQSNMELNQDSEKLNSNLNFEGIEDISGVSKTDNIKSISEDESSFTSLFTAINQSQGELNLTHDYKFNESVDKDAFEKYGMIIIDVDKDKFVLNGNNHVLDGAEIGGTLNFKNDEGEIIINDLTFKNYNQAVLTIHGNITLNNVNFTNFNNPLGI